MRIVVTQRGEARGTMEYIISAVVGWITSNILDKFFRKKTTKEVLELNNRLLIELLEEVDYQLRN